MKVNPDVVWSRHQKAMMLMMEDRDKWKTFAGFADHGIIRRGNVEIHTQSPVERSL